MFIYYDSHWRLLSQMEFLAGFVPELMAVGSYLRRFDTIHYDTVIICQYRQYFLHDFF